MASTSDELNTEKPAETNTLVVTVDAVNGDHDAGPEKEHNPANEDPENEEDSKVEDDPKNEEDSEKDGDQTTKEDGDKTFLCKLQDVIGQVLQLGLYASWVLHYHAFLCCICPLSLLMGIDNDILTGCVLCCCGGWAVFLAALLSPFITPFVVVYLINDVGGFYPELQSWQVSYCIWGCSCGILLYTRAIFGGPAFTNWLLWPFGIKAKETEGTVAWLIPLVSMGVSIIVGFGCNYGFEKRFILDCDESYTEGICYDTLCCLPVSSHDLGESSRFLGDLASNVLAAWGVIKAVGYFICVHTGMEIEDEEETKFMKNLNRFAPFGKKDDAESNGAAQLKGLAKNLSMGGRKMTEDIERLSQSLENEAGGANTSEAGGANTFDAEAGGMSTTNTEPADARV